MAGPGHGAPGVLGPAYLEGTYSEVYPDKSEDAEGLQKFFKQFSFPGGIGSHVHAGDAGLDPRGRRARLQPVARLRRGVRQSRPDRRRAWSATARPRPGRSPPPGTPTSSSTRSATARCCRSSISTATRSTTRPSWRASATRSWRRCSRATATRRISSRASDPDDDAPDDGRHAGRRHRARSARIQKTGARQRQGRAAALADDRAALAQGLDRPEGGRRPQGRRLLALAPGAVLRRARATRRTCKLLEDWLRSYKPEELFDADGRLHARAARRSRPQGTRRMSANPHANGGAAAQGR